MATIFLLMSLIFSEGFVHSQLTPKSDNFCVYSFTVPNWTPSSYPPSSSSTTGFSCGANDEAAVSELKQQLTELQATVRLQQQQLVAQEVDHAAARQENAASRQEIAALRQLMSTPVQQSPTRDITTSTLCPTDIHIRTSAGTILIGDKLTCLAASGHSGVIYTWTLKQTGAVTSGQTVTLTRTGTNTYNCTGAVTVQSKQCIISTVSAIAVTASSCLKILQQNPRSASDRYTLTTSEKTFEVYCEMGLNGGGYTFLSPRSLLDLTDDEVQEMFTDRTNFLMRFRYCDKTHQPYGVLKQLPIFSNVPLGLGLLNSGGYTYAAWNSLPAYLDIPFLFFGFLPVSVFTNATTVGLVVNNVNVNSTKPIMTPNYNYITLFPGFQAVTYRNHSNIVGYPMCNKLFESMVNHPTGYAMPIEFFMFYEVVFTYPYCHTNTNDKNPDKMCVTTAAIGFR